MLQGTGDAAARARVLRKQMSTPEVALWLILRERPAGLKFRRQHPSGPYVADFYCHTARLVIEVDGDAHSYGNRPQRDVARDQWFTLRGLQVLRIAARDILTDCEAVVRMIVTVASDRLTHPAPNPVLHRASVE
jgi:very-short-patch-repair endonuclease